MRSFTLPGVVLFVIAGCGDDSSTPMDSAMRDGGAIRPDTGPRPDAGTRPDGGPGPDAGPGPDGGPPPDTGMDPDAGGAMGDTCETAIPIADDGVSTGTTAGATNDYDEGEGCSGTGGADVLYVIDVAAGEVLSATVATTEAWDPSISLAAAAACDASPRVCLAGADSGGTMASDTVTYSNTSDAMETVYIVIDSYSETMTGAFTLEVTRAEVGPGDTCATAEVAAAPVVLEGMTSGLGNDFTGGDDCRGADGPDHVYSVDVPAGQVLRATATPVESPDFDLTLHVIAGPAAACMAMSNCLASADSGSGGAPDTVSYRNTGAATETVFLIVDGYNSGDIGRYSLDVALLTPGAGDTCDTADAIAPASMTVGTTVAYGDDFTGGSGCRGADGPDHFYSVTVPAGQQLTATATPDASSTDYDLTIHVIAGPAGACALESDCLASADVELGGLADTVTYTNTSAAAETVFVVVDGYNTDDAGGYTLATSIAPPPAGETCAAAVAIMPGMISDTTVGYSSDYASGCLAFSASGGDRVYSIDLPNGEELQVTIVPEAGYDIALELVTEPMCDASALMCVAQADSAGGGGMEMTSYMNTSGATQNVFIIVDGFGSTGGTYTMTVAIP